MAAAKEKENELPETVDVIWTKNVREAGRVYRKGERTTINASDLQRLQDADVVRFPE
ncbi:hypothetical protein SAMN04487969_11967 [Paenibacillus algorifonticola]|uniref:Uncharacterized protein n=1 Tax=Paenibacillus algorifonticola TaxID=684063 RepID=A0A1I2H190_9BACL|nr:hypothetical protein [Paenibacillus algorifonticola]SFF23049.1 hypothetical protein SAMN04487969_11967 [Paenibacillus algorifonticola]